MHITIFVSQVVHQQKDTLNVEKKPAEQSDKIFVPCGLKRKVMLTETSQLLILHHNFKYYVPDLFSRYIN